MKWGEFFSEAERLHIPDFKVGERLILAGLGGSGIACDMIDVIDPPVERTVVKDYLLPRYVGGGYSLIAITYSGNTVETLQVINRALEKGIRTAVITSGGRAWETCVERNLPCVKIPQGGQPRAMFPYLFIPLLRMINESLGIGLRIQDMRESVERSYSLNNGEPLELAREILGKIPVIYSSKFFPVAERMKQQLNENSKHPAFFGKVPEIHHNEVEGYGESFPLFPILIKGDQIDEVTERLLPTRVIYPRGVSLLEKLGYLVFFVDLVSIHLANLKGVDAGRLNIIPQARSFTSKIIQ